MNKSVKLQIQKLSPDATVPKYAHPGDAGLDLYAAQEMRIPAGGFLGVPTGIAMAVPEGYVGLIWDKSGLAINHGIKTMAGVIDASFRGEITVVVTNVSKSDYIFEKGHKVAQILIQPIVSAEVEVVAQLSTTARGANGLGSTGK